MIPPPPRPTLFPYTTLFRSISAFARKAFEKQGIKIHTGATVKGLKRGKDNVAAQIEADGKTRSEEHTSELQSRRDLVCRLLLEKKNIPLQTSTRHSPPRVPS